MADIKMTTPVGRAVFPALARPDTKFDPELGMYKADLSVPTSEAKPLMDKLVAVFKQHTGKAPNLSDNTMFTQETDRETGEPTGNIVFKLRVKNRRRKDGELWDRKPKLFDAELKPCDVNPWGGTEMAVNFTVYCWDAAGKKGVSLQPNAVQIINLVEGGSGGTGDGFGFQATEGFKGEATVAFSDDVVEVKADDNEFTDF